MKMGQDYRAKCLGCSDRCRSREIKVWKLENNILWEKKGFELLSHQSI